MAYREVTVLEVKEVVRQWLGGANKKRIAARLSLDVKTVRRYVAAAEEEGLRRESPPIDLDEAVARVVDALHAPGRPRGDGWATCTAERGFIANKLDKGVRLSKVHRLLRRRGVLVTYATLHRFVVAELDFGRGAPTIPVSDGPPGAEVQVDTGWVGSLEPDERGVRRRFRAWVFTAVLSGVTRKRSDRAVLARPRRVGRPGERLSDGASLGSPPSVAGLRGQGTGQGPGEVDAAPIRA
jgi:transposase